MEGMYFRFSRKWGRKEDWGKNQREECLFSRMRLGNTKLSASVHLIWKHPTGNCDACNQKESVEHVLLVCPQYSTERLLKEYATVC